MVWASVSSFDNSRSKPMHRTGAASNLSVPGVDGLASGCGIVSHSAATKRGSFLPVGFASWFVMGLSFGQ
jgi:hypothetical protein